MLHSRKVNALSCLREVVHIVYSVTVRSRAANGIFDWPDTGKKHGPGDWYVTDGNLDHQESR